MPGISGFEICKGIRNESTVPILVLTGRDKLKDELHALGIGADEYINKPCRKERLLARISNLLRRLEYARTKMQEDIERMRYYAKLKSSRDDYFFREISIKSICMEVLDEYEILLNEQGIETILDVKDAKVISDEKGLQFILRQIISNAIKYKKVDINSPQTYISCVEDDESISLVIRDNGIGIKEYDLPFIFDKGFTGEIGEQRKNSTGMGLYLAKQVADNLNITLNASMEYKEGFEISLMFPKVEN